MTKLPESVSDLETVLSNLPFGICIINANEQLLWSNHTLVEQLGLTKSEIEGISLDELPIDPCKESIDGIYVPTRHPGTRLRLVVTSLDNEDKLAVFSDVTDLTENASGYIELLRELSRTDSTTGLLTPNSLYRELLEQIARCRRYGNKLAVLRIFVEGIDESGVDTAEQAEFLREIAVKIADNTRSIDDAGQLSRGEFVLVLPETDTEGARRSAEKLESVLRKDLPVQYRFGIAEWRASDDATTLLERAK